MQPGYSARFSAVMRIACFWAAQSSPPLVEGADPLRIGGRDDEAVRVDDVDVVGQDPLEALNDGLPIPFNEQSDSPPSAVGKNSPHAFAAWGELRQIFLYAYNSDTDLTFGVKGISSSEFKNSSAKATWTEAPMTMASSSMSKYWLWISAPLPFSGVQMPRLP